MSGETRTTTNHNEIRKWAEARGGKPATVKRTESDGEAGVLRIDFPGYSGQDSLEEITWDEFFAKFDEKQLAFLYQDKTSSGEESRFFKLVSRDTAEHKSSTTHAKTEHKSDKAEDKKEAKAHSKSDKAEDKKESKAHAKAGSKSHK